MGKGGAARRRWSSAERCAALTVSAMHERLASGGCACAAQSAAPGSAPRPARGRATAAGAGAERGARRAGALARGDACVNLRFPHAGYREKVWDHAAGALIVAEAGARITDAAGAPPAPRAPRKGRCRQSPHTRALSRPKAALRRRPAARALRGARGAGGPAAATAQAPGPHPSRPCRARLPISAACSCSVAARARARGRRACLHARRGRAAARGLPRHPPAPMQTGAGLRSGGPGWAGTLAVVPGRTHVPQCQARCPRRPALRPGAPLDFGRGRWLDLHRGIVSAPPAVHAALLCAIAELGDAS